MLERNFVVSTAEPAIWPACTDGKEGVLSPCPPHHWHIESPHKDDGGTSLGHCIKCEDVRNFRNYVESAVMDDYRTKVKASHKRSIRMKVAAQ